MDRLTPPPVGRKGRLGRTAEIAGLGARSGGHWAMARARKVFADAARAEALDAERELRTTADVVEVLGNMKGALMKVGQMASYLEVGIPESTRASLTQLQGNAPPMSADLAASVISSELGAAPEELFESWDPVPIAAASIGQVHRAITADGRACAVKVQYPGVAEAIAADLGSAKMIFRALAVLFPGLDPEPVVQELRERLTEELDYEHEASNQRLFFEHYRNHPYIVIPEVYQDLSSALVLTTELATGATFAEVLGWNQSQRNRVAETIYRFSFGSIYRLGAFNGDPHPGNYLFHPDGSVTFLDFGLVKRFSAAETAMFERLLIAMVLEGNIGAFRSELVKAGLLPADAPFSDAEIQGYFSHFYDFVLTDETQAFTTEYAAAGVRAIFDSSGEYGKLKKTLNVPPVLVVLQRINLGLVSLFAQLGATANWRRIAEELWPFVDRAASTPMSQDAQEWRDSLS
ncbi:MAG: AarF/ABC1/UbiB kinase family protein [bacterium]|nr:AarF/ABC1/UbiB kinase family protein [bacterium]